MSYPVKHLLVYAFSQLLEITFSERCQTLGGRSFEIKGALFLNSVVSFPPAVSFFLFPSVVRTTF